MKFLHLIWCSFAAIGSIAQADERILDYHSEIRVVGDGSMQVDETIRVRSEGDKIRHGIYRDFPTEYLDRAGNRVHVQFTPIHAQRDGQRENFRSESRDNGVRVYLGDADVTVDSGEHEYVITYETSRQLGFFADHDELYWNATGNGWIFPIDHASAAVTLPGSIPTSQMSVTAYTGRQGAKGTRFSASVDAPSHAQIQTTAKLGSQEGLTIAVSFPKGVIAAPTSSQQWGWLLKDNRQIVAGLIGLLVTTLYLFIAWWRVGRDPRAGPIMPQYEAPEGFTPAELRYVEKMGYDDRCFAADLVDLGVRGAVEIHQDDSKYTLMSRRFDRNTVPTVELSLYDDLLGTADELIMEQSNHSIIGPARTSHNETIAKARGDNFQKNLGAGWIGVGLMLLTIYITDAFGKVNLLFDQSGKPASGWVLILFSIFPLMFGAFGVSILAGNLKSWFDTRDVFHFIAKLFGDIFRVVGGLVCLAAYSIIGLPAGLFGMVLAVVLLLIVMGFSVLLPAPTPEGRKLLDRIQGLRLYLGVAERDTLARMQTPQMTEQEFQKFLPYALALDVEKTWSDRFAATVGPAAAAAAAASMVWYQSASGGSNFSNFSSSLGDSLSSTISSSSSAPGSSSGGGGGGGGGSSGGGGGGGGGGGW
jgi:uncharacterized membrane protein YgcG